MNARGGKAKVDLSRVIIISFIGLAGLVALAVAIKSLDWRYVHDSPLMIYAAFLIDSGAVPYRDFFDMNMPGTYAVMWFYGKTFGWTYIGFRIFDLFYLTALSLVTFFWMRPMGVLSALFASIIFALFYLFLGPATSLQREYIALLPFALMLIIALGNMRHRISVRGFAVGFLISIATLVKPQFFILSLPVLVMLFHDASRRKYIKSLAIATLSGFMVPVGITVIYLVVNDALVPFLDMVYNYMPLYTHMTREHVPISGMDRFVYVAISTMRGLFNIYLPLAIVGIMVFSGERTSNKRGWLLVWILIVSDIYPALSGQFWGYHWIPFHYMALCSAALAVRPLRPKDRRLAGYLPLVVALLYLFIISISTVNEIYGEAAQIKHDSALRVPEEISDYLRKHMKQGDVVQPLDWTGGAIHGMLLARARLGTRFMYDFHFYHHIDSPYIWKLRREFIRELLTKKPRYIIQVLENRAWPRGPNTTRSFPELQALLEQHYKPVLIQTTYRILEYREKTSGNSVESTP